jgi:glycosyltransferase involved in cell wall biosynthesis
MHVAFVVTNYPPRLGGVESHVEALAGHLCDRGHQTTVVCLADVPGDEERAGVRVISLARRMDVGGVLAMPTPSDWRRARDVLSRQAVTHVSVHTRFFPMTWLGLRLASRLGAPSILTEHGGGHVASSSSVVSRVARGVDATFGRRALRTADTVLAVSERSALFVRQLSGRRATVLGNGTDAGFWSAGRRDRRRHVVFAGRLVPEKGWRTFVECLADVDADATIAGDGPDVPAAERAVRYLGLQQRVRLTGRLSRPELRAAFAGSVYVNPSVAAEGFQTTLLEAGLCGARIATYDVGGAAEVVSSGGAVGVVLPSGDAVGLRAAVVRLLDEEAQPADPTLLHAFDWAGVTDRFQATLEGLTDR